MVTVELLDVPGALTTKVPVLDGEGAVAQLVDWAKPTLALFSPPDDEHPFFSVGLVGGNDVVMICGSPPADDMEPDEDHVEPGDEFDWRPVNERLASVLEELIHSDVWHFGAAADRLQDAQRVVDYAFPEVKLMRRLWPGCGSTRCSPCWTACKKRGTGRRIFIGSMCSRTRNGSLKSCRRVPMDQAWLTCLRLSVCR